MKRLFYSVYLVAAISLCTIFSYDYEFAVIGAGPAGIISVGTLLYNHIPQESCIWISSDFSVGKLKDYANVQGNATTKDFQDFLKLCSNFAPCCEKFITDMNTYDLNKTEKLAIITYPLQEITYYLQKRVQHRTDAVENVRQNEDNSWTIELKSGEVVNARTVILATGSHPKYLSYKLAPHQTVLDLDDALDKDRLANIVSPTATVGVVGGSHSAILAVKNLYELGCKKIINFYKKPLLYHHKISDDLIHHAYNGLLGETAIFAKTVIEELAPDCIIRVFNSAELREQYLPECDYIVYAVGFERNAKPTIQLKNNNHALPLSHCKYNHKTGLIAPNLFGIGIAFPHIYVDPFGEYQTGVGVMAFWKHAQKNVHKWIHGSARDVQELSVLDDYAFVVEL